MKNLLAVRYSIFLPLVIFAIAFSLPLIGGCGGSDSFDGDAFDHDLTIILNVADMDGYALGDVTVWVDGVQQYLRTAWDFVELGEGYPDSWIGRPANWIKGGFTVTTYGIGDEVEVIVKVSKTGFYTEETSFIITDDMDSEVFAYETFIMEERLGVTAASEEIIRHKAKPGEVLPGTGKKPALTQYPAE